MKKLTTVILLVTLAAGSAVAGPEAPQGGAAVGTVSADGTEGSDVSLSVAGYELRLDGNRKASVKRTARRHYTGHIPVLEAGFNMLPQPGYKSYPAGTPDFMNLNNARSFQVALNVLDVAVPFNPSRTLGFSAALGIVWDDYVFSDNVRLIKDNGRLEPLPLDSSYKKSKLNTFAIRIPVMFEWTLPRGFFISAGVYGSAVLGSHTKIKFPKEKMRDPYTRPFEAGVIGRVGYRWIGVYCRRAVTSLFKSGCGPKVYPTTIGISIDL